jgi:hypothetical protein
MSGIGSHLAPAVSLQQAIHDRGLDPAGEVFQRNQYQDPFTNVFVAGKLRWHPVEGPRDEAGHQL